MVSFLPRDAMLLAFSPVDWRRQPGRPRITWLSTVQQDLKQHHQQQFWLRTAPRSVEDDVGVELQARNDDDDAMQAQPVPSWDVRPSVCLSVHL